MLSLFVYKTSQLKRFGFVSSESSAKQNPQVNVTVRTERNVKMALAVLRIIKQVLAMSMLNLLIYLIRTPPVI